MAKLNISICKSAVYQGDGKSRFVLWDDEIKGFGLRVYPSGRKAFIFYYRLAGRTKLHTIGDLTSCTPFEAREEALKLKGKVRKREDPQEEKKAYSKKKPTFSELQEIYIKRHLPKKKCPRSYASMLRLYIPKPWSNRELISFHREDIINIHQKIGDERGPVSANRFISMLRKLFNLAIDWGLLKEGHPNPCRGVERFTEKKRSRFIKEDELPRIWKAINEETDPYWRAFFILSLLIGTRRGELLSMRWEDVDLKSKIWVIPDTKPDRTHYIPLPGAAVIIEKIPRLEDSLWVFPSRSGTKTGHLTEPKKAWARIRNRAGLKDVWIHDLRRTVGSWLASSGESLVMIGKLLNHSQPSTTAIYARLSLEPVRAALERYNKRMMDTITEAKGEEEEGEEGERD